MTTIQVSLPVEDGNPLPALRGFLRMLLEAGLVEALLVPMRTAGGAVSPALVVDPALLESADPLAPVMPVNSATLAGKLSVRAPRAKIGAVLRACELHALVELTKLQQACLDDLTLIAVDCAGTYSVPAFMRLEGQGAGSWIELYQAAEVHPETPDPELRAACKICEQPVFAQAQIHVELFGANRETSLTLSLPAELGEKLGLAPVEGNRREQVLERLVAARTAARDAGLAALQARLEGEEKLAGVMQACIRCHNCMTVCPICYCKTCVFKSPVFDHEPIQFFNWARQKGAYRMPADSVLFHLTRLNHMALSCVGCGMCTEACPAELPVGLLFRSIGQRLQETFAYAPGCSLDEPLPLVTFKADEWTDVGE